MPKKGHTFPNFNIKCIDRLSHKPRCVGTDASWCLLPLNRSRHAAVLPAAEGTEVHPLCERPAPRSEARQHIHQHGPTAAQDRRLRAGQDSRPSLLSQGTQTVRMSGSLFTLNSSRSLLRFRNHDVGLVIHTSSWMSSLSVALVQTFPASTSSLLVIFVSGMRV